MAIQTLIYVCSHKAYVDGMLLYRPRLVTEVVVCELFVGGCYAPVAWLERVHLIPAKALMHNQCFGWN